MRCSGILPLLRIPFTCAKVHSYWIPRNYRDGYGMFSCYGILFNHESLRGVDTFVTRKITRGIVAILVGEKIYLENLDANATGVFLISM